MDVQDRAKNRAPRLQLSSSTAMRLCCSLQIFIASTALLQSSPVSPLGLPSLQALQGRLSDYRLSDLSHFRAFSCTGRQDAAYPDLRAGCTTYYRCLQGSAFAYICSNGELFDMDTQECSTAGVRCPTQPAYTPRCVEQSDGYYADYGASCSAYYRCRSGAVSGGGRCEAGAVWDWATGSCGTGPRLSCSPPSCWGFPDGTRPLLGSRCNAYYTCREGVRTDHVCPLGTAFDYLEKSCTASAEGVPCYEGACDGRRDGLHALPRAPCSNFFKCFNGALVAVERCPFGRVFDGDGCVTATGNFTCDGGDAEDDGPDRNRCDGLKDGLYPTENDNCRGFYRCRQKRLVRKFLCKKGLVFNEITQECSRTSDNDNGSSSDYCGSSRAVALRTAPKCRRREDGYHALDGSECQAFYLCRDGVTVSEHRCPGTSVFDGSRCVDSKLYSCYAGGTRLFRSANLPRRLVSSSWGKSRPPL